MSTYAVAVSSNGQISIPPAVRRRWGASRVLVLDKGTRIVVRPIPDDPISAIIGKYSAGPVSDDLRQLARREDAKREANHE